jgi:hypothetical protein
MPDMDKPFSVYYDALGKGFHASVYNTDMEKL